MVNRIYSTCVLVGFSLLVTTPATVAREDPAPVPDHVGQPAGPPPDYSALVEDARPGTIYRVQADPGAGFHWPYYISIPSHSEQGVSMLVVPNNDGQPGAPFETHEYWASIINEQARFDFGDALGAVVLTPVFPRPLVEGPDENLYTHALSRAAMLSEENGLERVDLQLIAMIDDARNKLEALDIPGEVFLWGFSAAGDFVTRMTFLHPERVRAVAAGGLGGFPMLPVAELDGHVLEYPVGTADFEDLFTSTFSIDVFRETPMLLLQGGADENDSVPEGEDLDARPFGSDSYSYRQAAWINATFGTLPVARVPAVKEIYEKFGMRDYNYHIETGVDHVTTPGMEKMILDFFLCVKSSAGECALIAGRP